MLSALVPMRACVSVCVRAYAIMYVCFCEAIYNCNDAIFKLCCTERETRECGSGLVNKYCFLKKGFLLDDEGTMTGEEKERKKR